MLDMVATNDIIYTQRNKITGVAGFTVTLSTNHLSTDGALAQVKINGAFVRNTWRRDAGGQYARRDHDDQRHADHLGGQREQDRQQQRPDRAQQHPDRQFVDRGRQHPGAGRQQQVSDPLSTGYLLANDNVSFTMVGVAQIPLVNNGAKARQINTILIDGVATNGSLIKAQRNVRLETNPSMLDQAKVNGSVQVIGLNLNPTVKLAAGVVDKASSRSRPRPPRASSPA